MTKETYQLNDGRSVIIDIDDLDYDVTVAAHPSGEKIGYMKFRLIEMPLDNHSYLHLTHAFLDEAGRGYVHKGIGRRCLELVRELSGLSISASDHDGQRRDDGSHLTGDAPGFVFKMREEGLIEGGSGWTATKWRVFEITALNGLFVSTAPPNPYCGRDNSGWRCVAETQVISIRERAAVAC